MRDAVNPSSKRRDFLKLLGLGMFSTMLPRGGALAADGGSKSTRPNLLFLMTDQQQAGLLGCAGNRLVRTPNLDRIASGGANFQTAYCVTPSCSPSRATILTGKYPVQHGIGRNIWKETDTQDPLRLVEPCETFFHSLAQAGYVCHHLGKYHVGSRTELGCFTDGAGDDADVFGQMRELRLAAGNFALAEGLRDGEVDTGNTENPGYSPVSVQECIAQAKEKDPSLDKPSSTGRSKWKQEYHTEWVRAEHCIDLIRKAREEDKPFAITCSMNPPHAPNIAPDPYYSRQDPSKFVLPETWSSTEEALAKTPAAKSARAYGETYLREYMRCQHAQVEFMDACFGKILDELDRLGIAENTLVIFASDHGDFTGEHGFIGKATYGLYEEVMRVPLLVRFPGRIPAGTKCTTPVSLVDLAPTILDYLQIKPLKEASGSSLRPVLEGDSGEVEVYAERGFPPDKASITCARMVRIGDWKFIRFGDGREMLFDIRNDSSETHNLSDDPAHSATKRELLQKLKDHMAKIKDPAFNTLFGEKET